MILLITAIILTIPVIIALYRIFIQAGRKPWEVFIPVYNLWVWIKVIDKPFWWALLLLVPFINIFVILLMLVELSVCFRRNAIWEYFAAAVLPFIYFPILLWVTNEHYTAPKDLPPYKKTVFRDWFDAIIFSVIAAMIIRMFFFENYVIPSSSMEKSMLVGDYVYVSKLAYGPRLPQTPIAFPLVHNVMPLTATTPSFSRAIQLPYRRFFQMRSVQRGDAVVFNFPVGDTVCSAFQSMADYYALCREYGRERVLNDPYNFGQILVRPVDKRENFVKRCVGVAGDTLSVVDGQVMINHQALENPQEFQYNYQIYPSAINISRRQWRSLGVSEEDISYFLQMGQGPLTAEVASKVRSLPGVEAVERVIMPKGEADPRIFPHHAAYPWNVDNYGPIYIPKKGASIVIDQDNLPIYQRIIEHYEGHSLEVKGDQIWIDGKEASTYTFEMDYFWMMGDNRHNSADSRYWGFVPEDHVVGRASFVWLSLDKDESFLKKIRWNKMFRKVK